MTDVELLWQAVDELAAIVAALTVDNTPRRTPHELVERRRRRLAAAGIDTDELGRLLPTQPPTKETRN